MDAPRKRTIHMNGKQVSGSETFICEECRKRGVVCGGVWRFHSQHGKYLLQCRMCRQKRRGCSFRKFESDGKPKAAPSKQKSMANGGRGRRSPSVISISDSDEGPENSEIAGPSSRPGNKADKTEKKTEKKGDVKAEGDKKWGRLEKTLLGARKQKVEIETVAEVQLARVNMVIEEVMRELNGGE